MSIRKQLFYAFIVSILITTLFVCVLYKLMWFNAHQTIMLTLGSFISSMITMIIAIFLLAPTIQKIEQLNIQTQQIAQGNFNIESLPITSPKELKELNISFTMMIAKIQAQMADIQLEQDEKIAMIQNLAHDLKTPLASIKSYSEGLKDGIIHDTEDIAAAYRILITQTDRLSQMFDDLTDLIAVNRTEQLQATINMDQLLIPVLESYQQQLTTEHRDIQLNIDHTIPPFQQDKVALERIITNFIDNALKFSAKGTPIKIDVSNPSNNQLAISVTDKGIGIKESQLPHIFKRTYRVEASRNKSTGGTGLGLYIAQTLAERIGGDIKVNSVFSKGTTITLTFPIQSS
jgi:two-component system sensor histidine kinase SaeS